MSDLRRAAWLTGALALTSCQAPIAEVIVVIRADATLQRSLHAVRVEARRAGAASPFFQRTYERPRYALPGEIAIVAANPDDTRPLEVQVYADVGEPGRGDFIHRATTRFQRNAVLYLDVPLASACRTESVRADCTSLGLTCGEAGRCIAIERVASPTPPSPDAGAPDGGVFTCRPRVETPAPTVVPACERVLDDAMERCGDGLDNGCDGLTDEGCCSRSCEGATADALNHCREVRVEGGLMTLGEAVDPDAGVPTPGVSVAVPDINVSPFRMDAYEVTVARFRRFVAAGMPAPPASAVMFPHGLVMRPDGGGAWMTQLATIDTNPLCNWTDATGEWESNPINCVDWYTAMAFCVWDGGRLPTEAEWEFAARYRAVRDDSEHDLRSGRRYPWGDTEPTCDDANAFDCDVAYPRATRPVGTRANGIGNQRAWIGIFDLAGNVAEHIADKAEGYDQDCWRNPAMLRFFSTDPVCVGRPTDTVLTVQRGGSSGSSVPSIRSAARSGFGAMRGYRDQSYGFRCVRVR